MNPKKTASAALLACVVAMTSSCAYIEESETAQGGILGALGGALIGGIIGEAASGDSSEGALIGMLVGAAAGSVAGHYDEKQREEMARIRQLRVSNDPYADIHQYPSDTYTVTLENDMLFEADTDRLKPNAQFTLNRVAATLTSQRYRTPQRIVVMGHSDNNGDWDELRRLSALRAEAVGRHLIARGIEPGRLFTVGMGPDLPLANNETVLGRARNQRIEILVTPLK